jgi:hypothetical protein
MSAMDDREPQTRYGESQQDIGEAAEVDETLEPGSMPGGPDYPGDAVEGEGASPPLAPDERAG